MRIHTIFKSNNADSACIGVKFLKLIFVHFCVFLSNQKFDISFAVVRKSYIEIKVKFFVM